MPVYCVEALSSMGGTLFTVGIFFYTGTRFGWGLAENFRLAAVQGVVYVAGAMSAHAVAGRLSHRAAAVLLQTVMAVACGAGVLAGMRGDARAIAAVVLGYTFASAISWPIIESLISLGADAALLARRLAVYNVVWPAVGAATLAASGHVIEAFPVGIFLVPMSAHLLSIALATRATPLPPGADELTKPVAAADVPHAEPELLRLRIVALWVSRLGLPATYAVIYGLMPLMPSLPAMRQFDVGTQTVVSSTWLIARWLAFAALAAGTWWHTRPRAMVVAAIAMLVAFVGITVAPSQLFGSAVASPTVDLTALVLWQVLLGAALGMIYTGSLYFGMVLSEGSTEHSGYHEALIGLGWILGPAAGAAAGVLWPGNHAAAVGAVGAVIAASVACVVGAGLIGRRRRH